MGKEKFVINILILINIFNFVYSDSIYVLLDHLFGQIKIYNPICLMKEPKITSSRGKVEKLEEIIKKNSAKELYAFMYFTLVSSGIKFVIAGIVRAATTPITANAADTSFKYFFIIYLPRIR